MQNNFLFDTNIFIYYFSNEEKVCAFFSEKFLSKNKIYFSVITEIELLSYPNLSEKEITTIKDCINSFHLVELTKEVVKLTIAIRKNYKIGIGDSIIAASALYSNSILVTRI